MERLIITAWRAFWIGLGASVVLLGQSVFFPRPPASLPAPPAIVAPASHGPAITEKRVYERARRVVASRHVAS